MTRSLVRVAIALGVLWAGAASAAWGNEDASRPALRSARGHSRMVLGVALSPDGRFLLTGSDDTTAVLWETATGREVRRFEGHARGVTTVAFASDGLHVLTSSTDGTTRLWSTRTGQEARRFEGHDGPVHGAAISRDGRFVVTASADKTARLWDAATGTELRRFAGHTKSVVAVALSPDGRRLLTGSDDRTVGVWDTATGQRQRVVEGHAGTPQALAFSPDGSTFAVGYWDLRARLWTTATGEEVRPLLGDTMGSSAVVFSSDGTRLLTGSRDGSPRLWATATGRQVGRLDGHTDVVRAVAYSSDGRWAITGSDDTTARLWEIDTGREVRRFQGLLRTALSVRFAPDAGSFVAGFDDGTAARWDALTGQEVARFEGHARGVLAASVSPDGRQVVTGSYDHEARLWDAGTGQELRRLEGHESAVQAAEFSADGRTVLTGSEDGTARLWEAATGRELRRFAGHTDAVFAVAFSPDGRYVLTGSRDATARLWAAATGAEVRRFVGHAQWVSSVAFSPDGTQVLTGSWDRTARLWQTETGRELHRLEGHTQGGLTVAFAPDGAQALTASWDGTLRLWDVSTGRSLKRLEGQDGEVRSIAWAPDGLHALASTSGGSIDVWDVAGGYLACSLRSFTDGTWAVVDGCGRFDASHGGDVPGLHWVVGLEVIALDQLKERYYDPGLLGKCLGGNPEPVCEAAAFLGPRIYPALRVEEDGSTLRIEVQDQGGGIGRVVVMVNGKERTADARGAAASSAAGTLTLTEDLAGDPRLLPGETNHIEVFAYNEEGYLRSRGVAVAVAPKGDRQEPSLWAVVAGVSDYGGDALDLLFAAKDAEGFAAAVETAGAALFGAERTHVTLLVDDTARRENLLAALDDLRHARSGDILLVYLAGHGVNEGDGFYYLTADAQTADLSDAARREQTAVSSTELIEAIKQIPALKQVLVLDTCSSGSFIEALAGKRGVPSSQVRALERVKDRTGTFVLAGCAADKVSYEATQYGQGLLTYSLLLGMKGGRLHEHDFVDVSTLFHFAADKVPEFARGVGGVQRPIVASPRGGNSFYIGRLTENERAAIPLQQARPLFLRSTLLDPEEGADLLDLGSRVDQVLGDETARGPSAAFVFVDTRNFEGAYRIAGTYQTRDGVTSLRFKLRRDKEAVTDWIEVVGEASVLPARIVEEAKRQLAASTR